jgi:hypothetical protein
MLGMSEEPTAEEMLAFFREAGALSKEGREAAADLRQAITEDLGLKEMSPTKRILVRVILMRLADTMEAAAQALEDLSVEATRPENP